MPRFPMLLLSAALLAAGAHAAPSVYPTGVTRYDPQKAFNQYVIFSGADRKTHLIDMNGNEVKRWDYPGFPAAVIDPALNGGKRGHVLLQLADLAAPDKLASPGNGLANQALGELDWDGKEVWRWGDQAPGGAAHQHHDQRRLANGNTLLLANKVHAVKGFAVPRVIDDVIYEVSPARRAPLARCRRPALRPGQPAARLTQRQLHSDRRQGQRQGGLAPRPEPSADRPEERP